MKIYFYDRWYEKYTEQERIRMERLYLKDLKLPTNYGIKNGYFVDLRYQKEGEGIVHLKRWKKIILWLIERQFLLTSQP